VLSKQEFVDDLKSLVDKYYEFICPLLEVEFPNKWHVLGKKPYIDCTSIVYEYLKRPIDLDNEATEYCVLLEKIILSYKLPNDQEFNLIRRQLPKGIYLRTAVIDNWHLDKSQYKLLLYYDPQATTEPA
jgi:hypothetical protein